MIAPLQNIIDRLTVAWHERAVALKAASFGMVGVANSAVDFGVFSFCYYYLRLPIIAANTSGLGCRGDRLLCDEFDHYLRRRVGPAPRRQTLFRFRGVAGRRIFRQYRHGVVPGHIAYIPAWAAKVAAIGVSFVINFSLSHFVVFSSSRQRGRAMTLDDNLAANGRASSRILNAR